MINPQRILDELSKLYPLHFEFKNIINDDYKQGIVTLFIDGKESPFRLDATLIHDNIQWGMNPEQLETEYIGIANDIITQQIIH